MSKEFILDGDRPLDELLAEAESSAAYMREEAAKTDDPVIRQRLLDGAIEDDAEAERLRKEIANGNAA